MINEGVFSLDRTLMILALAALLPPVIYAPIAHFHRGKKACLQETETLGISLVLTMVALAFIAAPLFPESTTLRLLSIIVLAALMGLMELRFQLGTQITLLNRLALITLAFILGFGFDVSERISHSSSLLHFLIDYPLTVIFYSGLIMTFELFDRLKGLVSGITMIVAAILYSLTLRWFANAFPLMLVACCGLGIGMLILQKKRRKHMGRIVILPLVMFLGVATVGSRSWGMTLPVLIIPLLAALVPMVEKFHMALLYFAEGDKDGKPAHLKSLLLNAGLGDRWAVFYVWLVTVQFGVLVKLAYETKTPLFAIAALLSFVLPVAFSVVFLSRLGERVERHQKPGRLRILFLSHYYYPEVNAPASRLYEHAELWTKAGHEVTILCPVPNAPHGHLYPGYLNSLWQEESLNGVRVIRIWTFLAANKGRFRRCLNYLSYFMSSMVALLLVRRHDVMIATTPQFFCGLAGAVGSSIRHEPFILEVRDLWPESIEAVGAGKRGIMLGLVAKLARWMYHRPSQIVTVGPGYRRELIARYDIPSSQISVIPNGILTPLNTDLPEQSTLRQDLGIAKDCLLVAYVGTVGLAHRIDVMIEAARLLGNRLDIHLLIAGDGAEKDRLEKLASHENLQNITFLGIVPKEEIHGLMDECDAFLVHLKDCPLFATVLPSKLFEAMGAGKPVILGVRGDALDVLEKTNAGIAITPESSKELVEAMVQLHDDPIAAKRMGLAGQQYVREHYNRVVFAEEYTNLMASVLSEASGKSFSDSLEDEEPEPVPDSGGIHKEAE